MKPYRVETFSAAEPDRGAAQHVVELDDPLEVHIYCTEPWRAASVHMAYRVTRKGTELFRAYIGGRCITPHLR